MVKKIGIILIAGITVGIGLYVFTTYIYHPSQKKGGAGSTKNQINLKPTIVVSPTQKPVETKRTIFLPYWNCNNSGSEDTATFDRVVYFGIAPSLLGIDKNEKGYKDLELCKAKFTAATDRLLALRMLNNDVNSAVLKNPQLQQKIIDEMIVVAKEYGFTGLAIDLEFGSNLVSNNGSRIEEFVGRIKQSTEAEKLHLSFLIYGDTFYRPRGIDVAKIQDKVDEIMVMAYDFHKANGESGPNFPYSGADKYGYDFQTMVTDFLLTTPKDKITVVFGKYGYDWLVAETKKPIRPATAVTLAEANEKFLKKCKWSNCLVQRDVVAGEMEINYIDEKLGYHIIWIEDNDSVEQKMSFLEKNGIGSSAIWAYGYY